MDTQNIVIVQRSQNNTDAPIPVSPSDLTGYCVAYGLSGSQTPEYGSSLTPRRELFTVQGTICDTCPHDNIDPSGCVCLSCGIVIEPEHRSSYHPGVDFEDARNLQRTSKKVYTLFDTKEKLEIPDDVIQCAEKISASMVSIPESNRCAKLLRRRFACLYLAYKELGIDVAPSALAEKIGMNPKEMSPALTMFSKLRTGYNPTVSTVIKNQYPSMSAAADYAKNIGLNNDAISKIKQMIKIAIDRDPSLKQRRSETVAAGAIRAYVEIHGVDCDLSKIFDVTSTTSASASKQILDAYNL